jgi:hypothetical protein
LFVCFWGHSPQWARAPSFTRILDHTKWRTTVGWTPLDEWWARRRDVYLTTHNTHNRQTSKPPVGFEPTISASERPQTYALDRAVTGTGSLTYTPKSFPCHPKIILPMEAIQTSYKILKLRRQKVTNYKCRNTIMICKNMRVRPL